MTNVNSQSEQQNLVHPELLPDGAELIDDTFYVWETRFGLHTTMTKYGRKMLTGLHKEDVVYMKALEAGDSSAQSASVTKKNALRDAPANSAIANASSISALKSAWDTSVLGDSPYA